MPRKIAYLSTSEIPERLSVFPGSAKVLGVSSKTVTPHGLRLAWLRGSLIGGTILKQSIRWRARPRTDLGKLTR